MVSAGRGRWVYRRGSRRNRCASHLGCGHPAPCESGTAAVESAGARQHAAGRAHREVEDLRAEHHEREADDAAHERQEREEVPSMPHLFGRYLQIRMNEVAPAVIGTGGRWSAPAASPALLPRLHAQRARRTSWCRGRRAAKRAAARLGEANQCPDHARPVTSTSLLKTLPGLSRSHRCGYSGRATVSANRKIWTKLPRRVVARRSLRVRIYHSTRRARLSGSDKASLRRV